MLRYDRQLALVSSPCTRHPARKRIGSILTTPEPARGNTTSEVKGQLSGGVGILWRPPAELVILCDRCISQPVHVVRLLYVLNKRSKDKNRVPTLLLTNNPGLFQDFPGPMKNFPGLFRSPRMFKYKEKTAFTYNIQSVVHCRKFSMKQNVLHYCCLFSI